MLLMTMFRNPQPVLDQLRTEYGPVVGLGFGPAKLAIVGGPAEVRSLFTRPVEDFRWNHKFNALAVVVGSESMITSDGDDWARRRASVQSAFSRRRLNGWIPMILAETALSYLGLGLRPPATSWGVLIQESQNYQSLALYPWVFTPAAAVAVCILAFSYLGDGLRDAVDPYTI